VLQWISSRPAVSLYTTSITQTEILNGVLALPAGRRRRNIETAADTMFKEEFSGRILAFDSAAARRYAELVNDRRRRGRPISQFGAQIAAIARVAGASVATRNVYRKLFATAQRLRNRRCDSSALLDKCGGYRRNLCG
jgi:predicted nucleic acid-binding protein